MLCLLLATALLQPAGGLQPPLCTHTRLLSALRGTDVAWLRRDSAAPRYSACPFISARYNCSRFATSAGHYRLGWLPDASQPPDCSLPTRDGLLRALTAPGARPLRLYILGDSHAAQLYQSLLCMYQEEATHVVAYLDGEQRVFRRAVDAPACHSVEYSQYGRFFLDDAPRGGAAARECSLNHSPQHASCFTLGAARVCSSYARPLHGGAPLEAGLAGLATLNLSLADFDVLALNTYLEPGVVGRQLRGFAGRVLAVGKWGIGHQAGVVRTEAVWPLRKPWTTLPLDAFCAQLVAAWGVPAERCTPLDASRLVELRAGDSKASIYPTWYPGTDGSRLVCQGNQEHYFSHPATCDDGVPVPDSMRVCDTVPCAAPESHFCLPGPTDDAGLLLLAAAAPPPQ